MVPDAARGVSGSLRHSFLGDANRLMPGISPKRRRHEYFHDHARIDEIMFDGALAPIDGSLHPADDRPGLGLTLRRADAEPHRVA